jgi:hypothetical protein
MRFITGLGNVKRYSMEGGREHRRIRNVKATNCWRDSYIVDGNPLHQLSRLYRSPLTIVSVRDTVWDLMSMVVPVCKARNLIRAPIHHHVQFPTIRLSCSGLLHIPHLLLNRHSFPCRLISLRHTIILKSLLPCAS